MFFATTGAAFAIKAGRKIRNIWNKLAKNIVRNEQQYNRCYYIAESDNSLRESYCPHVSTIYAWQCEAAENEYSEVFLRDVLFHDVETGYM